MRQNSKNRQQLWHEKSLNSKEWEPRDYTEVYISFVLFFLQISGITATLGRHGAWNMVYFGLYHNMKSFVPSVETSPTQNLLGRIVLGFTAGSLASLFNIPFDVAKSRIQGFF